MPPKMIETTTYRVLRKFSGQGGKELVPGEVVDVSEWREKNVDNLVHGRYISPIYDEADVPHHLYQGLVERLDAMEERLISVEAQLIAKRPGRRPKADDKG